VSFHSYARLDVARLTVVPVNCRRDEVSPYKLHVDIDHLKSAHIANLVIGKRQK